jgi:hypothetical protein
VEFVAGEARVARRLLRVVSVDYLDIDLGALTCATDDTQVRSALAGESLAAIAYVSRYMSYTVHAFIDAQLQLTAYDDPANTAAAGAGVDVQVQRYSGTRRGADIVDGLIGNIAVALARGRNALDAQASNLQDLDVETRYRDGVRTGQVMRFFEYATGEAFLAKVAGITHRVQRAGEGHFELWTALHLKRPTGLRE